MNNVVGFLVSGNDGAFSGQIIVPGEMVTVVPIGSIVNISDNTKSAKVSESYVVSKITADVKIYQGSVVQLTWMHLEPYQEI